MSGEPTGLRALQRAFRAALHGDEAGLRERVAPPPEGTSAQRVGIYSHAYSSRLVGALGESYPATRGLLGADGFERIARAFVLAHPSRTPNLRWYGAEFADLLRADPGSEDAGWRADLALFEWTLGLAFDAADQVPIAFADVAARAADLPILAFDLHPSLHRVGLARSAVHAWAAWSRDATTTATVEPSDRCAWAIWREGLDTRYRELPQDEAAALAVLAGGAPFAAMCDTLATFVDESEAAVRGAGLLRQWIDSGWIVALRDGTDDAARA